MWNLDNPDFEQNTNRREEYMLNRARDYISASGGNRRKQSRNKRNTKRKKRNTKRKKRNTKRKKRKRSRKKL